MNYQECLFIGGPADGERRSVEDPLRHEFYRVTELPPPVRPEPFCATDQLVVKHHTYFRKIWLADGSSKHYFVYVHESQKNANIFELLLDGYRQP